MVAVPRWDGAALLTAYGAAVAEIDFDNGAGVVTLRRPFTPSTSPLRAWTSADRLLIDEAVGHDLGRVLIVDDAWGALSVALASHQPFVWTDSILARQAIDANLEANGKTPLSDRSISGHERPTGAFDTVLIVVPKSNELLEWRVRCLAQVVTPSTRVVAGGLSKYMTRTTTSVLAGLGEAVPRRAVGRARLIDVQVTAAATAADLADSDMVTHSFTTSEGVDVWHAPGVFSAGHLDVGTSLLLDELGTLDLGAGTTQLRCIDLASGNGVVGATLALRWPTSTWRFVDASDLATAAATATARANDLTVDRVVVETADGLSSSADNSVDLVVSNPPFHQGHAEDLGLTARLLAGAGAALASDGRCVVVAQRHVQVDRILRRFFASVEAVSRHPSHVVVVAERPRH